MLAHPARTPGPYREPRAIARPDLLTVSLGPNREGLRILAYDDEAGKGDHVHRRDVETPYRFTTYEKLLDDFLTEVGTLRGGQL